jgi:[histone H3]-lysine36 N-dimethyltransferase SETMAR
MALLERLNDEIKKKTVSFEEKKVLFHQENAPCHKSIKTTAKLHELGYELVSHPPYSPDLAPNDFFLFADLKRMLAGNKFSTNEEVIVETEAHFEAMSKSYYKNSIEKLYDRYNRCIALERKYIE